MQFINIGFGNLVAGDRIISVVNPDSAPVKRTVQEARTEGLLIDATQGRKTGSVIIADSGHVILSYLSPSRIMNTVQPVQTSDEE